MGLNRVSNPRAVRRLARLLGQPVLMAYARWFESGTLLVFTDENTAWVVRRDDTFYRYDDHVRLVRCGLDDGCGIVTANATLPQ